MTREHRQGNSAQRTLRILTGILVCGWTVFWVGCLAQVVILRQDPGLRMAYRNAAVVSVVFPLVLAALATVLWRKPDIWWSKMRTWLERHTNRIDGLPDRGIAMWIALAAALSLFTELMVVRLHGSFFQLFAYFKNVSLLSCFLGLGIGYARGSKRPLATPLVLPLLTLQIGLMHLFRQFLPWVGSFLQNPVSEQLALGLPQAEQIAHLMATYGFLSLVFALNVLCLMPLGHLTSRLMCRRPNLIAYGWNLIGSLLGIVAFYLLSFLWCPPAVWILLLTLTLVAFLGRHADSLLPSVLSVLVLLTFLGLSPRTDQVDVYSPYQILTMTVQKDAVPLPQVNNVYFQRTLDLRAANVQLDEQLQEWAEHYALPYYFKPRPERVLIVGSGTGNDVAAGIRHDAGEIDAVEIDPAILEFGKTLHPESPYQAANVNAIVDDARAFIRHAETRYDLIVYGLLDSHTLLSGMSGVRLDSFVYTVEAFREASAKLTEDGILSMTFSLLKPEMGRKIFLMLEEAFDGQSPVAYRTGYDFGSAFLIGNGPVEPSSPLPPGLEEVTSQFADSELRADKSTDDWPFFYMPVRKYPASYMLMILLLLMISTVFISQLMPGFGAGSSLTSFFLGAGFMLVETRGITELALIYGSTWVVVGAVVSAILAMGFIANVVVMRVGAPRPVITYGLLIASLIAGLLLPSGQFSALAPWLSRGIVTALLALPLLFSGLAFSTQLAKSASAQGALSLNLLGAILGGFLEYNSMYFGIRSLYVLAIAMYALAFLGSTRAPKTGIRVRAQ